MAWYWPMSRLLRDPKSTQKKQKLKQKSYLKYGAQSMMDMGAVGDGLYDESIINAKTAYLKNPIIYRAVRLIVEGMAHLDIELYVRDEKQDHHAILRLLKHPNFYSAKIEFFEEAFLALLLDGNLFLRMVLNDANEPIAIYQMKAEQMEIKYDEMGWPDHYIYRGGKQSFKFEMKEDGFSPIFHQTYINPMESHWGISPLASAKMAVLMHNFSSRWNLSLLKNSARPSGAVIYHGQNGHHNLTDDQYERIKAELNLSYQGTKNSGRPMVLDGGLDWANMALSPKEMDFIEAKHVAAREIALALGVPPMLLGIPGDNKYANFQEAQRSFMRQTILPLMDKFLDQFSNWLRPIYGDEIALKVDMDQIVVLSSEREALWRRVNEAGFLDQNEKRALVGYAPINKPQMEAQDE